MSKPLFGYLPCSNCGHMQPSMGEKVIPKGETKYIAWCPHCLKACKPQPTIWEAIVEWNEKNKKEEE